MKAADKAKWVEALRSGVYRQGRGKLCSADNLTNETVWDCQWCCLGIAFDILATDRDACWVPVGPQPGIWSAKYGDGPEHWLDLPPLFMADLGIEGDDEDTLVRLNDTEKASFAEIADWIEENL
jgi:hypothetical protein